MALIGFVPHPQREGAFALAKQTCGWLEREGHESVILGDVYGTGEPGADVPVASKLDLAVSLGGDGTMLRTVDIVSKEGVPVLGVNMGHLGYLTAVEPDNLRSALERFVSGDYQIESRMTLDVSVTDDGHGTTKVLHRSALNDLVVQRASGHTVRATVTVNQTPFLTFMADSIILATPTGSTAYNLSARGPIASPRARVQILTPVAPHMLFDRSLILDADDRVAIALEEESADLVVDGWKAATLTPGQTLHSHKGSRDALLVTFGERDFHDILKRKFNLSTP